MMSLEIDIKGVNPDTEVTVTVKPTFLFIRDFFDYEWIINMCQYHHAYPLPQTTDGDPRLRRHFGKWFVWDGPGAICWVDDEILQKQYIDASDPISGVDSLVFEFQSGVACHRAFAWDDIQEPHLGEPPVAVAPTHLRIRFRVDEWVQGPSGAWMTGLIGFTGNYEDTSYIWSTPQMGVGLISGYYPPYNFGDEIHLILRHRVGHEEHPEEPWKKPGHIEEVVSEQKIDRNKVYTLEMRRYPHLTDGEDIVYLGAFDLPFAEVPDLALRGIDTSFPPEGIRTITLGCGQIFQLPNIQGSRCKITVDEFLSSNQLIGPEPIPTDYYDLILDSSPQGKRAYVGNHYLGETPQMIRVPAGTMPKVFVGPPAGFSHWEIEGSPDYSAELKSDFSSYYEIWDSPWTPEALVANSTGIGVTGGPYTFPTPTIWRDTKITGVFL